MPVRLCHHSAAAAAAAAACRCRLYAACCPSLSFACRRGVRMLARPRAAVCLPHSSSLRSSPRRTWPVSPSRPSRVACDVVSVRSPPPLLTIPYSTHSTVVRAHHHRPLSPVSTTKPSTLPQSPQSARHARVPLALTLQQHSTVTHASAIQHAPRRQPPMTDANYSRSPAPRNSSLADLVHRNQSAAPLHPQLRPSAANSDDGSQQERNHQRPSRPVSNMQLLPPPGEVSRNAHIPPPAIDTSPKHMQRKRNISQLVSPMLARDISSLTQKPDDHASSVAQPQLRISPLRVDDRRPDKFQRTNAPVEGSTDMLPAAGQLVNADNQSPSKSKRRALGKESRTELLEENRSLRIELELLKNKLRSAESRIKKMHKSMIRNESLLHKYRSKLVDVFESGGDARLSLRAVEEREHKRGDPSKLEGESVSNSQEEAWSAYSPSASFDPEQSVDIRRMHDHDVMSRSEGGVRKHRRTRAPAWTAREEEIFMKAYHKYGCQWKLYQDSLPGRSRRQIQSHGSYLIRQGKLAKKNSRPWQRRKPRHDGAPSSTVKDVEVETQEVVQRFDEE